MAQHCAQYTQCVECGGNNHTEELHTYQGTTFVQIIGSCCICGTAGGHYVFRTEPNHSSTLASYYICDRCNETIKREYIAETQGNLVFIEHDNIINIPRSNGSISRGYVGFNPYNGWPRRAALILNSSGQLIIPVYFAEPFASFDALQTIDILGQPAIKRWSKMLILDDIIKINPDFPIISIADVQKNPLFGPKKIDQWKTALTRSYGSHFPTLMSIISKNIKKNINLYNITDLPEDLKILF
jgi:hypothetical protein